MAPHLLRKYYLFTESKVLSIFESSCAWLGQDNRMGPPLHVHTHSQNYESDLSNTLLNREDHLYCLFYPLTTI